MLNLLSKRIIAQRGLQTISKTMLTQQPVRGIKLHEYQAGALLDKFNVRIPLGTVAFTPEEVFATAQRFENGCVVKSQILGGGRGQGHIRETGYQGGVKVVDTAE